MDFSKMAVRHCISDLLVLEQYVLFQSTVQELEQGNEVSETSIVGAFKIVVIL
jgi:hypothetical protein